MPAKSFAESVGSSPSDVTLDIVEWFDRYFQLTVPRCTGVRSRPEKVTPRCGDVGWSTGVCGCSRRPPLGAHNEQIRIEMPAQLRCVKREEVRVQSDTTVGAVASKFD